MEQDVEKFIKDPSQQMEFQQLPTSYLRLAAHQHYSLQSMVLLDNNLPDGSASRSKTSEFRLPLIRLADIPVNIPTEDNLSSSVVKVAIKQRPNKRSQVSGGLNSTSSKNNSLKREKKSIIEHVQEYLALVKQERNKLYSIIIVHYQLQKPKTHLLLMSALVGLQLIPLLEAVDLVEAGPKKSQLYAQRFDPGFGFNGGSYPIQPLYTPVLNYNTEFPQLGSAHRSPISTEHQPRALPQHLPGPWVPPSSPAGIGYRPPDAMMAPFSPSHAGPHSVSTLYLQYPCQRPGMTFIHPRDQINQHYAHVRKSYIIIN
ncbi:putative R3H domain superfamily protein [Helianthus anomalus]